MAGNVWFRRFVFCVAVGVIFGTMPVDHGGVAAWVRSFGVALLSLVVVEEK